MDGMLSQEEINALLSGMGDDGSAGENQDNGEDKLSDIEKDAIGEISNISMGTAATTVSSLVNQKVNITTPVVDYADWDSLTASYDRPCVFLQISYKEGLNGNNILILKENDVKIIADLMMGGDGTNTGEELGEFQLSAISEAMNQMMGSAATALSSMMNIKIDIMPPIASLVDMNDTIEEEHIVSFLKNEFVKVSFRMTIGDLVDSELMQLYPIDFTKSLCTKFMDGTLNSVKKEEPAPKPAAAPPPMTAPQQQMPDMTQGMPMQQGQQPMGMPMQYGQQPMGMPMQYGQQPMGMPMQYGQQPMGMPMQYDQQQMQYNVQPAQFQAFSNDLVALNQKENINLIMDVPLEVTVELGRTSKSIQDILEFAPGTIIELNRIAGEPIDVLVNGKFVAKGEVVVIEESFGIRVTEIINK